MNILQEEQFEQHLEAFIESDAWFPYHTPTSYALLVSAAKLRIEENGG
jgi:hypothetical protein